VGEWALLLLGAVHGSTAPGPGQLDGNNSREAVGGCGRMEEHRAGKQATKKDMMHGLAIGMGPDDPVHRQHRPTICNRRYACAESLMCS